MIVSHRRHTLLVFFFLGQSGLSATSEISHETRLHKKHSFPFSFLVINRKFVSNINENSLSGNHALQLVPSFTDMERIFLSWEKTGVYSHDRPLKPWQ